jgi:hypothetical protein
MTDLNMSRIKLIWSKIWNLIKEHFNKVHIFFYYKMILILIGWMP